VTTGGGKLLFAVLWGAYADDTLATATGIAAGDSVVLTLGGVRSVYRRAGAVVVTSATVLSRADVAERLPVIEPKRGRHYARPQRASSRWHSAQTP
jgi:hypothetical protein